MQNKQEAPLKQSVGLSFYKKTFASSKIISTFAASVQDLTKPCQGLARTL